MVVQPVAQTAMVTRYRSFDTMAPFASLYQLATIPYLCTVEMYYARH